MNSKKLAAYSTLLCLALALSFAESFIPTPLAGVRLGLANTVTVFEICVFGPPTALLIALSRCVISGLLFAGPMSIAYSAMGTVLSVAVMAAAKRLSFGTAAVSASGAVAFNAGQLCAAALFTKTAAVFFYLPVLAVTGAVFGVVTGMLVLLLKKPLSRFVDTSALITPRLRDAAAFILPAVLCAALFLPKQSGNSVTVSVAGEPYGTYSLSEDGEYEIKTDHGANVLTIKNGEAIVSRSDCKGGDCMRQRADASGGVIICLPHRVVIEVKNSAADAVSG